MDTKDIIRATNSTQRLIQNENYYKDIFKKTEKVISVVFYIAYHSKTDEKGQKLFEDILSSATSAHNAALLSLEAREHIAEEPIRTLAHGLIALESKLKVAETANLITSPVMTVIASEIDAILRSIKKFLPDNKVFAEFTEPAKAREKVSGNKAYFSDDATRTAPEKLSRRERIKAILGAKEGATIKDIAEIIVDCSEKTIQRELNMMIEDNLVKRQGERRWSKYFLI